MVVLPIGVFIQPREHLYTMYIVGCGKGYSNASGLLDFKISPCNFTKLLSDNRSVWRQFGDNFLANLGK